MFNGVVSEIDDNSVELCYLSSHLNPQCPVTQSKVKLWEGHATPQISQELFSRYRSYLFLVFDYTVNAAGQLADKPLLLSQKYSFLNNAVKLKLDKVVESFNSGQQRKLTSPGANDLGEILKLTVGEPSRFLGFKYMSRSPYDYNALHYNHKAFDVYLYTPLGTNRIAKSFIIIRPKQHLTPVDPGLDAFLSMLSNADTTQSIWAKYKRGYLPQPALSAVELVQAKLKECSGSINGQPIANVAGSDDQSRENNQHVVYLDKYTKGKSYLKLSFFVPNFSASNNRCSLNMAINNRVLSALTDQQGIHFNGTVKETFQVAAQRDNIGNDFVDKPTDITQQDYYIHQYSHEYFDVYYFWPGDVITYKSFVLVCFKHRHYSSEKFLEMLEQLAGDSYDLVCAGLSKNNTLTSSALMPGCFTRV